MNKFIYSASVVFTGLIMLAACSYGPERNIEYSIYTTHSTIALIEGEELQIIASPSTQSFVWESTDPSVAKVSSSGLVTAIADGTCFINITSSEGLFKSIPVDVEKLLMLEGIEVINNANKIPVDSLTLLLGQSMDLLTSAFPTNYNEKVPFNLSWESSDESIVKVSEGGKVTPVFFGKAEITVSVADKPTVRRVIPVDVLENPITAIKVDSELILTLNKKHNVIPTIIPADYGVRDSSLVWKSTDESVVKVLNGEIDPVGVGRAIVTVSLNSNPSITANIDVLVANNPVVLNRSNWEIIDWNSCISEEPQYVSLNRIPEKLLDGNVGTFWGSKWDEPKPLPYYFVFDMKKESKIFKITITKPNDTWRGNLKKGYFEISNDNVTWSKLSDWSIQSNAPREHSFSLDGSSARYIKFVITEAFEYNNQSTNPASGARCDLSEFNVLGESIN